jgi:hypothetical protein
METKQIIGWKEWISLPELEIPAIKAKVDTGARTSALHTYKLERVSKDIVKFHIHPIQKRTDISVACETKITDVRVVKDSGGHEEERIFISTPILLNNKKWDIELSLTNRENMLFRMLLGRNAIVSGSLTVDPDQKYTAGKNDSKYYDQNLEKVT